MVSRLAVKHVYAPAQADGGLRVPLDRPRPGGSSKAAARIVLWTQAIASGDALRHRFGHAPEKWEGFRHHCAEEFAQVSWLYAARDEAHANATALLELLQTQQS